MSEETDLDNITSLCEELNRALNRNDKQRNGPAA
jgi:hypothetical protein